MRRAALFAAMCAAALTAAAQQPPSPPSPPTKPAPPAKAIPAKPANPQARDAFKGRLEPGLYEVTVEADMSQIPGVPKEKARQSQKVHQCMTREDIDRGMQDDPNCPMKAFAAAGDRISVSAACKDGNAVDSKLTFVPGGYTVDIQVRGKEAGKPFTFTQKVTSKRVGPCPAK